MIVLTYYESVMEMKNIYNLRKKMVIFALQEDISKAAVEFSTTRKTVRKWILRYKKDGIKGLTNVKRSPKNPHNKMSEEEEKRIIQIRQNQPYLGPIRIKYEHNINRSQSTIARVIKKAGLTHKRKKKYKTKRDLREVKQRLKAFEKVQIDNKELRDIPKYFPYLHKNYPKYQITARDVRTGICFISYSYEKTAINSAVFLHYVCKHLENCGVNLEEVQFQTDNGTEFTNNSKLKYKQSFFEKVAEFNKAGIQNIPPGCPTYNSDVEAAHRLIEDEFYDVEDYSCKKNFLHKAFTYILYFNYLRKFRYKNMKSPIDVLKDCKCININDKKIGIFKPVILDNILPFNEPKGGYHVPGPDTRYIKALHIFFPVLIIL